MPELIDMKLPKKTTKELKSECAPMRAGEQDRWPYGLQLRFEKEQVEKIQSLKGLVVGQKVNVAAIGCVTSVRQSERQGGGKDHSIEIQIEQANVVGIKKPKEMGMKEFSEWRQAKK
jgi:hypothetical protein